MPQQTECVNAITGYLQGDHTTKLVDLQHFDLTFKGVIYKEWPDFKGIGSRTTGGT